MKPHSDPDHDSDPDHSHSSHHHHHRPNPNLRLSVPPRASSFPPPYPTPTPTPTPSRRRPLSSSRSSSSSSLSSLFLLLFSLRSLYSLLPFVRAAPSSFSLFPFSFLVSLSSSLFLLPFSPAPLTLPRLSRPQLLSLASKSLLLSLVLLFRFHSLVYCRAGASIVADLSGSLLARFLTTKSSLLTSKHVIGLISLTLTLLFLSWSWDRVGCFPLSNPNPSHSAKGCVHLASMLMPFLSGFLGFFEQNTAYWGQLRELGKRRVRVLSLCLTTAFLFIPALVSFLSSREDDLLSVSGLGWPLVNTVIFGVILSETYSGEEKRASSGKEYRKGILLTFVCTLVLELFYYPNLSLAGFMLCGFFLWISVLQLGPSPLNYIQLGDLDDSVSIYSSVMGPIKHILSERKSRKIAAFLLINACYMVVEFVVGFLSNSLGLISDACHMLFDCAALAIGLYASYIARLPANSQFNYGRGRFEVLSGYVNAVFLVLVGALIVLESFERILDPMEISTGSLLAVSVGGLFVNVIGLVFFHEEHHHAHGGGSCSHDHHHHHHHNHAHAHPNGDDDGDHRGKASHVPSHNNISHECSTGHKHSHSHTHGNSCSSDQGEGRACSVHHVHESHQGDLHLHMHSHEHTHDHHEHEARSCFEHNHDSTHGHVHEKHNGHSSKHHHHHVDHNMEGIFLHVLADTMGSVGVVISTLLIKYKGWLVADPICSVFISVMIVSSVLPLLRNSAEILLQRVPRNHEKELQQALEDALHIKGVCGVHNMHVWNLTNTDIVGSFHLCLSEEADKVSVLKNASDIFRDAGIKDLTIQLETVRTQS